MKYKLIRKRRFFERVSDRIHFRRVPEVEVDTREKRRILFWGGGFKTRVNSERRLAEEGVARNFVELLTYLGNAQNSRLPLGILPTCPQGYDLELTCSTEELVESGVIGYLEERFKEKYRKRIRNLFESASGHIRFDISEGENLIEIIERAVVTVLDVEPRKDYQPRFPYEPS